ncbi:MAG TPA: long-chain fatty acid--CoA ligase [Spirochaetota bacterium]|nr:long-chain fatty acid--CoA ligase [Spirochaetota bacterium]HOS39457.1 long-chain fatty acid--CoA ligase [Spirochaetota bacterium]HPU89166.1 long-chain fatty acid--CoA ligase [Spirochaetota bacterium]
MLDALPGKTMPEIFFHNCGVYGERACVSAKDRATGAFGDISWGEMDAMVRRLAYHLIAGGVRPGDRIAVFSPNRYEWWVADLAILSVGAVNVPIYPTNSIDETRYIFEHAGVSMCFAASQEHLLKALSAAKGLPGMRQIVVFDDLAALDERIMTFAAALENGAKFPHEAELAARLAQIDPETMATIIYTSGTTGNPKGVMLSHRNFVSNARQVYTKFKEYIDDRQVLLSFLPLSHSLERTAGYYMPMAAGCTVAFCEDFTGIIADMQAVRPTFIISVPRLYEKIHTVIRSRLPDASIAKKLLFRLAMGTARRNLPLETNNVSRAGIFALRYAIFNRLVYARVKEALGMDRMQFAVSGGAPLAVSDAEFFIGMGIRILEGFGLTETTPVASVNTPWRIRPGTVGAALPETELTVSDDGELLIRGPQVMMGYYRDERATAEAFTADGFFRTGDLAAIDDDGYVRITGRIKDIIVTAGGKNISPQNIENSLKTSIYIEQVAVIGDRRKYLTALVIPAFEPLRLWAERAGIAHADMAELIRNDRVIALFQAEIDKRMASLARVETIKRFTLLDAEWTQDTGELTPSLKVKRRVLEEKYRNEIEAMYPPE